MNRSLLRFATVALIPAAALSLNFAAVAQAPPATPPAATTPSTQTPAQAPVAPATPSPATPAPPAAPAPSAATPAAPVTPPVVVETPAPVAPAPVTPPPAVQAADPFGEEITLAPKQVLAFSGKANWDSAFETLMDAFKQMTALLDKQSIKPSGNPMIVYTSTDDTGFTFLAEIPVDQEP
ncbi:MAG: AraC family transcriptional regulator, partial [Tardiphaga sp.]|nr:AraC family transcriptional regulator [Tardiphaga sp.]